MMSATEISVAENYHKLLGHLTVAGDDVVVSLSQKLSSSRILNGDDMQRMSETNSVKDKAEIILDCVSRRKQSDVLCRHLEEVSPRVFKSLLTQITDGGTISMRDGSGDVESPNLMQSLEFLSCERDLLDADFKTVSKRLEQMAEQLAHSQTESAGLKRQNESDRQELTMLRRKILAGGGGNPVLNKMYETLVERYDSLKKSYESLQIKFNDESNSWKDAQHHLKLYGDELGELRTKYNVLVQERGTRSIQMRNMNDKNDSLQRDLLRVRDERTLIKREYSLIMSERDAVHKEIQKLTDDISDVNSQLSESIAEKKLLVEEKEQLVREVNSLKQNRGSQQSLSPTNISVLQEELFVAQRERKLTLDQYDAQLHEAYMARQALEVANEAVSKLKSENKNLIAKTESLNLELKEAAIEARDAMRNRDLAFSEREKMRCERDEIKKNHDQLAIERERIMKQLESEIKEHDVTKEAKKRIWKELRDLQPHGSGARVNTSSSSNRRDNTDSHDSAIDTCEFGSEEISTLDGGGVPRRLKTFRYKLPRQPDLNLETGLFVTRSSCPGIAIEDRVVCINDTTVDSNNAPQLQRLVPNSNNPCVIKVMRSSSPPPMTESLNFDFGHSSVDSEMYTARQNAINKTMNTVDAECQTLPGWGYHQKGHRPSIPNSTGDESNEDTITPMVHRNIHHVQSPSACVSSGGESHQSTSTYSDSTHSTQAIGLRSNPSNKSSDSNVSFHRSSSKREKKKGKTKTFWEKIGKKSKPQSPSVGTVSGIIVTPKAKDDDATKSSGGTWPRLESPPIAPFGGRLSVFKKKTSRPTISSTTFTPPMDSAGRTPPTVIRSSMTSPTAPNPTPQTNQENLHPSQPLRQPTGLKRQRPVSVPIEPRQPFSVFPSNASNNNNLNLPPRPVTPKTPTIPDLALFGWMEPMPPPSASQSPRSMLGSLVTANQNEHSNRTAQSPSSNHSNLPVAVVTAEGVPITRPDSMAFEKPNFERQQSGPPLTTIEKSFTLPDSSSPRQPSRQLQRQRHVTSPSNSNLQPRTVRSLPRPHSAKTTSSRASSHQSIGDNTQIKPIDCRRIRIPSEISVVQRVNGSDKGSINSSDHRLTPIFFPHKNRPQSNSPAPPFNSTPTFHHPSMMQPVNTTFPGMSPSHLFHPSSTPLIPSPPSSTPPAASDHILDSSVPIIPGSTLSSLSNASASYKVRRPPVTTEPRYVSMVKGIDPIGISIAGGGPKGGIFVSRINEGCLAARAGLEYGDQLLEYNGINLRSANEEQGRVIMSQATPGDNITFLAQYNLEKYRSSTECNLPENFGSTKSTKHHSPLTSGDDKEGTITPNTTPGSSLLPKCSCYYLTWPEIDSITTYQSSPQLENTVRNQPIGQPRDVFLTGGCEFITLVGGNNIGVFIESVGEEGETINVDLKTGDQVLEYNSVDLRNVTLERASRLLAKPKLHAMIRVYFNTVGYSKLTMEPGDFFFVRTLFDNIVEPSSGSLPFTKNSILLIDNTYPDHVMGSWSAWLVDEHGEKTTHGKVPSKFTVEKDNWSHRDLDDSVSYAGSTATAGKKLGTGRRSFFKRRKPHRTSSRSSGDIKLHKSTSETSLESTETNYESIGMAYQVVERHVSPNHRPVVVFGPHSNSVCERLTKDYGNRFSRCSLDILHSSSDIHELDIIETLKIGGTTRALTVNTLEREMQKHRHVLLEVSQDTVDRLHSLKIYPIIVFIEYSSAKKVKESQDRIPGKEKISMKQCKELFERANSVRRKLSSKYLGAVYIHGGSAVVVAKQISTVVDREQRKVLWLPAPNDLLNY